MKETRLKWKELKSEIGQFVSQLDGLYKGAENIDEAISKAEVRGYKAGYDKCKLSEICKDCPKAEWFNECNGYFEVIRTFMSLPDYDKITVKRLIDRLASRSKEE